MFHMNNKKTTQRISAVIIALLILAILIPTVSYLFL